VPIGHGALDVHVDRGLKRGHFRGQKRATFFSTLFRHKFPSLCDWGICGETMLPVVLQGGPREAAKVARFESAVDTCRMPTLPLSSLARFS